MQGNISISPLAVYIMSDTDGTTASKVEHIAVIKSNSRETTLTNRQKRLASDSTSLDLGGRLCIESENTDVIFVTYVPLESQEQNTNTTINGEDKDTVDGKDISRTVCYVCSEVHNGNGRAMYGLYR